MIELSQAPLVTSGASAATPTWFFILETRWQHHRSADLTLEVALGVVGICIVLVVILMVHRWRQARAARLGGRRELSMARAVNEANRYLSTDVGRHLADDDDTNDKGGVVVASGNILDTVTLENTLSETKA